MTAVDYRAASIADLAGLLARINDRAPELSSRAERAAGLLASGKVRPFAPDGRFEVTASGRDDVTYIVDALAYTCDCADFQHGGAERNGVRYCKHLIAALMLRRMTAIAAGREQELERYRREFDQTICPQPEPEPDPEQLARVPLLARMAV